eukprot:2800468-Rhodomonas_salina.1
MMVVMTMQSCRIHSKRTITLPRLPPPSQRNLNLLTRRRPSRTGPSPASRWCRSWSLLSRSHRFTEPSRPIPAALAGDPLAGAT